MASWNWRYMLFEWMICVKNGGGVAVVVVVDDLCLEMVRCVSSI